MEDNRLSSRRSARRDPSEASQPAAPAAIRRWKQWARARARSEPSTVGPGAPDLASNLNPTLLAITLVTVMGVGIRLLIVATVQQRRERANRQINERLRLLMAAYKTLGGSFTGDLSVDPAHLRERRQLPGAPGVEIEIPGDRLSIHDSWGQVNYSKFALEIPGDRLIIRNSPLPKSVHKINVHEFLGTG